MANAPTSIVDEISIALANIGNAAASAITPTLRLGVTGLSRAGKTIFITALIHKLLTSASLPGFTPMAEGRLIGARLSEHPDKTIPRFAYEQHLLSLAGPDRVWPQSTRRISQLRLTLKFQSKRWISSMRGPSFLHLDIVDYPGEWLLDLPLLSMSFSQWSKEALKRANRAAMLSGNPANQFLDLVNSLVSDSEASQAMAQQLATSFAAYLRYSRGDNYAMSALPPGRFLLPGDLEGSPALTFAPLPDQCRNSADNSLYAMMARRYHAYKTLIVRPFFRDHFARLDRQIVLVDVLRALNAGPEAIADLQQALSGVLACFRQGANNPLSWIVAKKIDKILFAATKADHVHHNSHDRLEQILNHLVLDAARNARFSGAQTRSIALAAIRATREGTISDEAGKPLECLIGTPLKGEKLDGTTYDGTTEIALFPGDLPANPDSVLASDFKPAMLNFLRFRPPEKLEHNAHGEPIFPHIRLDRAMDYLLKDWMR
ncbi:Amino acid regulated cytosolic protein [hydrothermal vent metagenome]|uniref:Amino acid regulated cytosolic protein n=1 Tax=hydrothermal vent metagenome TaxID=652676 RepID=A0A3B0TSU5_9ZZZZ